jgi:hypothetical protein
MWVPSGHEARPTRTSRVLPPSCPSTLALSAGTPRGKRVRALLRGVPCRHESTESGTTTRPWNSLCRATSCDGSSALFVIPEDGPVYHPLEPVSLRCRQSCLRQPKEIGPRSSSVARVANTGSRLSGIGWRRPVRLSRQLARPCSWFCLRRSSYTSSSLWQTVSPSVFPSYSASLPPGASRSRAEIADVAEEKASAIRSASPSLGA